MSSPVPDLKKFSCYCVDLSDQELHLLMRQGEWRRLETLGVGHVCTGCRADYRLLKTLIKRDGGLPPSSHDND